MFSFNGVLYVLAAFENKSVQIFDFLTGLSIHEFNFSSDTDKLKALVSPISPKVKSGSIKPNEWIKEPSDRYKNSSDNSISSSVIAQKKIQKLMSNKPKTPKLTSTINTLHDFEEKKEKL